MYVCLALRSAQNTHLARATACASARKNMWVSHSFDTMASQLRKKSKREKGMHLPLLNDLALPLHHCDTLVPVCHLPPEQHVYIDLFWQSACCDTCIAFLTVARWVIYVQVGATFIQVGAAVLLRGSAESSAMASLSKKVSLGDSIM